MKTTVFCTLQFQGIHNWPTCPIEEVKYLRDKHRHVFHVRAVKAVYHDDRDVEFIQLKHKIQQYIHTTYHDPSNPGLLEYDIGSTSCEQLAYQILMEFQLESCEVNEDGENGATVSL